MRQQPLLERFPRALVVAVTTKVPVIAMSTRAQTTQLEQQVWVVVLVGGLVVIALIARLFFLKRRRSKARAHEHSAAPAWSTGDGMIDDQNSITQTYQDDRRAFQMPFNAATPPSDRTSSPSASSPRKYSWTTSSSRASGRLSELPNYHQ